MLTTLWRLFGDKMFKVHFELQQHIDKRKLHTVPEDEQHQPRLVLSTTTDPLEDVAYSMATFWGQNVQGAF